MVFEDFRVGAVVDGHLRLERLIASGGGGAVFEARRPNGDAVALKVLRLAYDGLDDRRRQRFLREARIAMRLRSPHSVRLLELVTPHEGAPYLLMEYLEGETLADRVRRCGPLPVPDAVDCILQAIGALAEMHDAGIIHRDVKPSNLFLVPTEQGASSIKLLDFGIATPDPITEQDVELTQTDSELGTPLYMAPEQFLSAKYVDARADVWSLGVTLFQLLTGRLPFLAPTLAGLSLRILYEEPDRLEDVRPEVPRELASAVMRCLAKEPAGRIASVKALGELLAPFAGREVNGGPDAEATLRFPLPSEPTLPMRAPRAAGPGEEVEELSVPPVVGSHPEDSQPFHVSFETSSSHGAPRRFFGLTQRAGIARAAVIALAATAWVSIAALIGQAGGASDGARAVATPAAGGPKVIVVRARDTLVERPGTSANAAPRWRAPVARPVVHRALPRSVAPPPSSPPPRPAAPDLGPIDDRID